MKKMYIYDYDDNSLVDVIDSNSSDCWYTLMMDEWMWCGSYGYMSTDGNDVRFVLKRKNSERHYLSRELANPLPENIVKRKREDIKFYYGG